MCVWIGVLFAGAWGGADVWIFSWGGAVLQGKLAFPLGLWTALTSGDIELLHHTPNDFLADPKLKRNLSVA